MTNKNGGRRTVGALLMLAALLLSTVAVAGIADAFASGDSDLHAGTIYRSGYQVLRTRSGSVPLTTKIPVVDVRLDQGPSYTVESTPLFRLYDASPASRLKVDVQLDANGSPKRIRYQGRWYGAGPPLWFWIGFGAVLLVAAWFTGRAGGRRLRRPREALAIA